MLPKSLKPIGNFELIRIGKNNDGGYLVEKGSLRQAKTVFSFGVCDDWSFEEHFLKINKVRLEAFDHTISAKLFAYKTIISAVSILIFFWRPYRNIRNFVKDLKTFVGYIRFFRQNRFLNNVAVGYSGRKSVSLPEILNKYTDEFPVFIKCDIEGWEYRILDDLILNAGKICGLVVEFHDVDLNINRIKKFVEAFPLKLVHIHPNNYGGCDKNGDPIVIEMSFALNPSILSGVDTRFPNPGDYPNNQNDLDIDLSFSD